MDTRVDDQDTIDDGDDGEESLFGGDADDSWDDLGDEDDDVSADDIVDSDEELKEDEQPVDQGAAQQGGANGKFDEAASDKQRFIELAEKYAMSEELATQVMADPVNGLPFMQAKMHVAIEKDMAVRLTKVIPHIVDWVVETVKKQGEHASKSDGFMASFKQQYPDLASPKLASIVMKELVATKSSYPKLSDARVQAKVASSVRALLETSGKKKQQQQRPAASSRSVTASRSGREEGDPISKLPASVRERLRMAQ